MSEQAPAEMIRVIFVGLTWHRENFLQPPVRVNRKQEQYHEVV